MLLILTDLRNGKLRTVMVIVAIASSVSLLLTLSSLSNGLKGSTERSLDRIGADLYVVPEDLNPLLIDLQRFDQGWAVMEALNGSDPRPEVVSPRLKDSLFFKTGEGSDFEETIVHGMVPGRERLFGQFRVISGEWFRIPGDPLRESYARERKVSSELMTREMMISSRLSQDMGLGTGSMISIFPSINGSQGFEYRVVGIYVNELSKLERSTIIRLGELQYIEGLISRDTLTEILVKYPSGTDMESVLLWSESGDFGFRDQVDLYRPSEVLEEINDFIRIVDGFSFIVTATTSFVCLVFTSTIFSISARKRGPTISFLKAIGISNATLMRAIVLESVSVYLIGVLAGLTLGGLLQSGFNELVSDQMDSLPVGFTPFMLEADLMMALVGGAFIIALLSGMVPALISMNRPPAKSLRGYKD